MKYINYPFVGIASSDFIFFTRQLLGWFSTMLFLNQNLATNEIGGNPKMVYQQESKRPSLVTADKSSDGKTTDTTGYKLHLALDNESYARLVWLKGDLHAASFGEVLRRALTAYEIFEPDGMATEDGNNQPDLVTSSASNAESNHLYIVIPSSLKAQLDEEKSAFGRAYKETIRRALCVFNQLVRDQAELIADIKKGAPNVETIHDSTNNRDGMPKILAVV